MIPLGVLASARVASGGGAVTATYIDHVSSSSGLSTYTFTGAPIGTADADREVLIVVSPRISTAASATVLSSATIAGVSATVDFSYHPTDGDPTGLVAFARAAVPTGTTGTIAVTLSNAALRCWVGIYTLSAPAALIDTATLRIGGLPGTYSATLDASAGESVVAGASWSSIRTPNFTAPVEDVDTAAISTYFATFAHATTPSTSYTVTATEGTGGGTWGVIAAATYAAA